MTNYEQAVEIVTITRMVSISTLQRRIGISFHEAMSIIEKMETNCVVSSSRSDSDCTRQVLVPKAN